MQVLPDGTSCFPRHTFYFLRYYSILGHFDTFVYNDPKWGDNIGCYYACVDLVPARILTVGGMPSLRADGSYYLDERTVEWKVQRRNIGKERKRDSI
jgi:hypothetical protein